MTTTCHQEDGRTEPAIGYAMRRAVPSLGPALAYANRSSGTVSGLNW